jgi:hypothetical protein
MKNATILQARSKRYALICWQPLTTVSNTVRDFEIFMWGCYSASLQNCDISQVTANYWNHARQYVCGHPPPGKLDIHHMNIIVSAGLKFQHKKTCSIVNVQWLSNTIYVNVRKCASHQCHFIFFFFFWSFGNRWLQYFIVLKIEYCLRLC